MFEYMKNYCKERGLYLEYEDCSPFQSRYFVRTGPPFYQVQSFKTLPTEDEIDEFISRCKE